MKILLDTAHTLEFDKVLDLISTKCVSDLGMLRLKNSQTINAIDLLEKALCEVSEAKDIYVSQGGIPLWAFDDIRIALGQIEPMESYLEAEDCQKVQNFLEVCASLELFFKKNSESCPELNKSVRHIEPLTNLLKSIQNTIDPSGNIYDNASQDLKYIRSKINTVSNQIHTKLERIIRKNSDHLQEDYITLREGRLVIPVREYSVNKIPGIVHGQSATGQTHYVEPMSVVPFNNEISELYNQEKREVIRILKRLSATIRDHRSELLKNLDILVHLDAVQAKAQYSIASNGVAPKVNTDFVWDIRRGYHPLLLKKLGEETVPLSVQLGKDYRMVIITGPNAGGKTVALKTVGLLQLLFQCGFHIPVEEESSFPVCQQMAAVIGDEQSIENDLSTFSSHITKINDIIDHRAHRSLVLIDEVGSGTDPAEGSALAIALLEELNSPGVVTLATTHLGDLKAFAHRQDQVTNAAMQFDFNHLSPLFKLEIGVPGSSYAFDISQRLGVKERILNRARDLMGRSHNEMESMINDLTVKRQAYDEKSNTLSIRESELEGLKALYQTRADDLKKNRKKYETSALEESRQILDGVNRTIENVIREIKESQAGSDSVKRGKEAIRTLKKQVQKPVGREAQGGLTMSQLAVGQMVRSQRFELTGKITKISKAKTQVEIDAKGVKITIPFSDILLLDAPEKPQNQESGSFQAGGSVMNEIDLRGKISEDALVELDQYLDQALNSEWQEVRIIHGKGTGVLRSQIHSYLKKNKKIKSYRLGSYGEGDTGVTIITI